MEFKVHHILKNTKVEGPDTRYCIWFQGCSKHCPGCWAKDTWDINKGIKYTTENIINDILNTKNIEGVTFLGGEPFEQFDALFEIAHAVHNNNLGTLCFTGKNYSEIKEKYSKILPYLDLLIDGGFEEKNKDFSRPWVGSSNQNYYFLSDRYKEEIIKEYKNKIEINIKKNGAIFINGMGDFNKLVKNLKIHTQVTCKK